MYSVCKRFRVPVGHRLSKHKGLCHNIHGHNLLIEVSMSCETLNDDDMVVDFHDFKDKVTKILDVFDHTTLLNPTDDQSIKFFKDADYRMEFITDQNQDPTAEVFCEFLFKKIEEEFGELLINFVRIWENDNSYAEYSEPLYTVSHGE